MQTAYFHRAYWSYENNVGIAKIHYPDLGIFALLFENGVPIINVNFLDRNEFSYYWQKYQKSGISLHFGLKIGIDTELTRVIQKENIFIFPEINLEVKLESTSRYFRPLNREWIPFQDDVFVEYQPCDSLIDVK
ncbi:hypothetical protein IQ244_27000 [Nostoc sp. LEGE 06077]|uniref:hypothetical protein n=1 Tax=Nostoc sp. LEGE 06077 TaxID=915325 RepID=UPI00187EB220|nr:hypothetical protein [Nostoc sp. LEGE 06077]MBE9210078.1 hypothetical protein [Nostoc sp. LEGE 06077]